ncbi:uncharacterized protein [Procambarus clarkii]|uniref:uncharacterized protein n=1 Tax=Procambarus clarkii TaxID=6728 RepID=UPI001E6762C7|nr:uncharacterized protein LOC123763767 [Procambarus clarkii]
MMDIKKREECTVCYCNYDAALRQKCTLPCGHVFCGQCIENAVKNDQLSCPRCHAQHSATAAIQFLINCGGAFVGKGRGARPTTARKMSAKRCQDRMRGISKKLRSMAQEQKKNINSLITVCEEALSQLVEYRGQLGDWKTHHLHLQDRLYGLLEQNKTAIELLEKEDSTVVCMTSQGQEGKQHLQTMLGSLDTASMMQDNATIAKADQFNVEVKEWLQKCKKLFPDVKTVHTSMKVQEAIRETLEIMKAVAVAKALPGSHSDSTSDIMKKVDQINEEIIEDQLPLQETIRETLEIMMTEAGAKTALVTNEESSSTISNEESSSSIIRREPISTIKKKVGQIIEEILHEQITIKELSGMEEPVKKLVEEGLVYAVLRDVEGIYHSARITFHDEQLFLHALLCQSLPPNAHIIQFIDVLAMLDPATQVFLDLAWAGSTQGRVQIQLCPDTRLARQFLLLCTGQLGHSYVNTRLTQVLSRGRAGEYIVGGDYEFNDGKGGASLLPDLQGETLECGESGAVWSPWGLGSARSAQFSITTRDVACGRKWPRVFGHVENGLELVRLAVRLKDIREVTVVDCGVVLPF